MPITPQDYAEDAIKGSQLERLVKNEVFDRLKGDVPETLAHALCVMAAEIDALKAALSAGNIGERVADSLDAQTLKVGGEDVASAISGKAASDHTHDLTLSTSSGNPDYTVKAGHIIAVSAGGTTKKVQIAPDFVSTLEDPFIPPDVAGSIWRNANTGDIWVAKGASSVNDWILVHNRIHDLIVQRQSVVVSGHGDSRPILCDKQDYTTSSITGNPVYARVSPYDIAKWKNRGDVIQFGGEVDYDPWGDGYPMRMTEYQATKDSNDKWYCTNINLRGYKYNSSTEGSYWGNLNHDDSSGEDFIEFQSW